MYCTGCESRSVYQRSLLGLACTTLSTVINPTYISSTQDECPDISWIGQQLKTIADELNDSYDDSNHTIARPLMRSLYSRRTVWNATVIGLLGAMYLWLL